MENQIQRVLDAADLRLKINQVLCDSVDIVAVVGYIMDHKLVIQQLRTNSKLLVGLVHIFSATVRFVLLGLNYPRHGFSNIPGANIRENPFSRASSHTMSMPETFALDEIHLPTEGNSCNEEDRHVASHDKITLKDPPPPMPSSTCLQFKDLPWLDLIADKTKEGGRHEEEGSGVPLDSATTIDPLEYKKWPDDLVDIKDMRNATATIPSAVFKKSVFTGQCDELSNVHNHIHVRSRSLNYPPSSAEHIVDGTNTFPSGNVTDEANEIVDREDSHVGSDTGSELSTEPQVTAPPVLSNNEGRQQPHEEEGSGVPLDSATTLDPRVYKKWLDDPSDIKEMRNSTATIPSVVFKKSVFTGQCDELSSVHNHIHVRSRSLNYPPISAEHIVDGTSTFPSGNVTDEAEEMDREGSHGGLDIGSELSTEFPQVTAPPVLSNNEGRQQPHEEVGMGVPLDSATTLDRSVYAKWLDQRKKKTTTTFTSTIYERDFFTGLCAELRSLDDPEYVRSKSLICAPISTDHIPDGTGTFPSVQVEQFVDREDSHVVSDTGSELCTELPQVTAPPVLSNNEGRQQPHEEEGSGVPLDSATTLDPRVYKKWLEDPADIKEMRNATDTIPSVVFEKSVFTGQCDELSNVHNHIHVRSRSLNYPPISAEHVVDGSSTFPSGNVTDEADEIVYENDAHVGWDTPSKLSTELPQDTATPVRFSAALRSLLDREPNIPSMSQETSTNSLQFTQRASAVIECFKEYAAYHRLSKKLINLSELLKDEPRRVCAVMLIEVLELLCSDYLTVEFDSSAVRNPLIIYDIMLRPTKKLTRLILFET